MKIVDISNWVENTNYGKSRGLKGKEGVIDFCEDRLLMELAVIEQLGIPVEIIRR